MIRSWLLGLTLLPALPLSAAPLPAWAEHRHAVVLENAAARLLVDLQGGAIGDFQLAQLPLNPLQWATPKVDDVSIRGFGHFLCLDRWGPPSDAEGARGMPYHGEAAHVAWNLTQPPAAHDGQVAAEMTARLPRAGLSVRRTVTLARKTALFAVAETVTNEGQLGRLYNAVQHPTIGPPFLDENTVVDCNGRHGFAQGGALPHPEEPSSYWPRAYNAVGESVDLRHLAGDPNPGVATFAIDEPHGWITAANSARGLLLGYLWKTDDYPWVSVWRDARNGKPLARGLEFGSTGLHQPFPTLAKLGRIWDRPLFAYLDAGESESRRYVCFLLEIPPDFRGVESIRVQGESIVVQERPGPSARSWKIQADDLIPR